jgi:DNA-binding response OmpR family regulator
MATMSSATEGARTSHAPRAIEPARVILIADDDELAQDMLGYSITKRGHRIVQTMSGCAVMRVALETQPDLIVLDVGFPDADGRDLLRELKAEPRTAHIPVLVWSGRKCNSSDARIALELGAEDYVEKSDPELFMLKIERVLLRLRQEEDATRGAAARASCAAGSRALNLQEELS